MNNGYYQGQIDEDSLSGLGSFFWDTGDFYFGEWARGAPEVGADNKGRRNHVHDDGRFREEHIYRWNGDKKLLPQTAARLCLHDEDGRRAARRQDHPVRFGGGSPTGA